MVKQNMNRRGILGLIAATPLAGKAVAEQAVASTGLVGAPFGGMPISGSETDQVKAAAPLLDKASAVRMIFGDAKALAEIRSELAENELRNNPYIDPDIQIMRSFSPMAKIAFQRQRNIERALARMQNTSLDGWISPYSHIRALEKRLNSLMWGKSND